MYLTFRTDICSMNADLSIFAGVETPDAKAIRLRQLRSGGLILRRVYRGFMAIKSLVVGLFIIVLWGRSYVVGDQFAQAPRRREFRLGSAVGVMIVQFVHDGNLTHLEGSWHRQWTSQPREILHEVGLGNSLANTVGFGFNHHDFPAAAGMVVNSCCRTG